MSTIATPYPQTSADGIDRVGVASASAVMLPIICALFLLSFTFSFDADGSPLAGLDPYVSFAKLLTRCGVLALLTGQCLILLLRPTGLQRLSLFIPLIGFVLFALLSTAWSPLKQTTLFQAISTASLVALSASFALSCRNLKDASSVLASVSFLLCGLLAAFIVLRFAVPSFAVATRAGTGLFHATNTAATAAIAILLVLSCRMNFGWGWSRWLLPPVTVLGIAVLILSVNRLSLGLTAAIGIILICAKLDRILLSFVVLATVVAGAVLLAVDPGFELLRAVGGDLFQFASRDQGINELSEFSGREEMWEVVWASYLQSPIIGHGYFVTSADGVLEVWYQEGNFTAHNLLLQALASVGLIGTGLFVAGVLLPMSVAGWKLCETPSGRTLLMALLPFGAWYLGWGLLNESVLGPLQPESVVFFALLGIAVGLAFQRVPYSHNVQRPAARIQIGGQL
ncbi:O-antigen ligase family protein [Stratiformator vulcanicus]|uniref:O-Antigen ligase n=1 Tax=Stratiformator vulcanicus TaxID=2527980 RepID=A0A517QWC9_9PLAN|nr:O-antigen ligase family protein [Stratiformator vulcanicus]QDT35897.1 O-Antigen ligase [Stratiformator vulcanicus]